MKCPIGLPYRTVPLEKHGVGVMMRMVVVVEVVEVVEVVVVQHLLRSKNP